MTRDRLNFTPEAALRASWSTSTHTPGRFVGVVKEVGTDAWLWHCERALKHAHETRGQALACARERIAAGKVNLGGEVAQEATDADRLVAEVRSLLVRVHERLGGGVDIQTFADGTVEARWKRLYGDELSDERFTSARSITDVLAAILRHEDDLDAADAGEEKLS